MTKVYSEDLAIAKAIISKDERTTREYLYKNLKSATTLKK